MDKFFSTTEYVIIWAKMMGGGLFMKTFKLISLQIVENDGNLTDIDLLDGLIINKEDDQGRWLVEAYVDKSFLPPFQKAKQDDKVLQIQAVITKHENDPAPFLVKVHSYQELGNNASILLLGTLRRTKKDYAELLLQDLITRGFKGESLLVEFKDKMKTKPRLATSVEKNP